MHYIVLTIKMEPIYELYFLSIATFVIIYTCYFLKLILQIASNTTDLHHTKFDDRLAHRRTRAN